MCKVIADEKKVIQKAIDQIVADFDGKYEIVLIDVTQSETGLAVLMGKMLIRWGEVCVFKACVRACGAIASGLGRAMGEAVDGRIGDGRTVELVEETRKGWERTEDLVRGMVKELMQ